jgi:hypothetical protein
MKFARARVYPSVNGRQMGVTTEALPESGGANHSVIVSEMGP